MIENILKLQESLTYEQLKNMKKQTKNSSNIKAINQALYLKGWEIYSNRNDLIIPNKNTSLKQIFDDNRENLLNRRKCSDEKLMINMIQASKIPFIQLNSSGTQSKYFFNKTIINKNKINEINKNNSYFVKLANGNLKKINNKHIKLLENNKSIDGYIQLNNNCILPVIIKQSGLQCGGGSQDNNISEGLKTAYKASEVSKKHILLLWQLSEPIANNEGICHYENFHYGVDNNYVIIASNIYCIKAVCETLNDKINNGNIKDFYKLQELNL